MSKYKYVTPYWRDSMDLYEDGIALYTGTVIYILNYGKNPGTVNVHFYDQYGTLLTNMFTSQILPARSFLDLRLLDVIAAHEPSYTATSHIRQGSMKVTCEEPLVISGKMYNDRKTLQGTETLQAWSIPFEEVQLEDIQLERFDPKAPIPFPDKPIGDYSGRRRYPK